MLNPPVRSAVLAAAALLVNGQEANRSLYRVDVDMVALTFTITDSKGKTVGGLRPEDIRILEDGVPQKIASFAEGSKPRMRLLDEAPGSDGTNVFILLDTSNRMYEAFPHVCDSVAAFLQRLDPADSVALYSFSRNLSRAAPLTRDHALARAGLSNVVAGDDTALLNSLLLTLRDAAKAPGRKAVVVFSNGPDNASMVTPSDVGRVAEDEGIPIYVSSTQEEGGDRTLATALQALTVRTGGKMYLARSWQKQANALNSVREDIGTSYTAYYYPAPNSNTGFRSLRVEIVSPIGKTLHVRTRAGYESRRQGATDER